MKQLIVPESGLRLNEGSIVELPQYDDIKWILRNGWYSYEGDRCQGWYVIAIGDQTILPINEIDLNLITLISANDGCSCIPSQPPNPNHCHPPLPEHNIHEEVDRAFITVDTLAQRNKLNDRLLPHGKIVRVNNVNGAIEYYEWDQVNEVWLPWNFGASKDIEQKISNIESSLEWGPIK